MFYLGYSPLAPGTLASLAALLILSGLHQILPQSLEPRLLIWLVLFILIYIISLTCLKREIKDNNYDQSWVVADEFLGMMVAYLPFLLLIIDYPWWWKLMALILFRFFDIKKPCGIKKIHQRRAANAVFLDDILAGFYSVIIFYAIITIFF